MGRKERERTVVVANLDLDLDLEVVVVVVVGVWDSSLISLLFWDVWMGFLNAGIPFRFTRRGGGVFGIFCCEMERRDFIRFCESVIRILLLMMLFDRTIEMKERSEMVSFKL